MSKAEVVIGRIALVAIYGIGLAGFLLVLVPAHRANAQAWRAYNECVESARAWATVVYVTQSGDRYHTASHYSDRTRPVSFYDAQNEGYTACKVCRPVATATDPGRPPRAPWYLENWGFIVFGGSVLYLIPASLVWAWVNDRRDDPGAPLPEILGCPSRHTGGIYLVPEGKGFFIRCATCHIRGVVRPTRQRAVVAWNNRVLD